MRSDTKVGNNPIGIAGQNGSRQTLLEYFMKIKQKSKELGVNGVAIVYWNNESFCPTYETRFINIIIINEDRKIVVPKRSSNRRNFPNCYDFSVGRHVNSGEEYDEAAYRELKEELGIINVKLQEVAYISSYDSNSKTFQKVYILKYNKEIINYDQDGIEKICYMTKEEIKALMNNKPDLFKTDYFIVIEYLFDKKYL